jgi:hypothetical protein
MRVLVACEFSGTVRDAFIAEGHDAISCDLLPTESPGPHYQGDVFDIIDDGFDLMIAHPPCTYLSNSGAKHLYIMGKKENGIYPMRWDKMERAALFFKRLWESKIPKKALENPIMMGYAKKIIGVKQSQIIHPYQFGHPERKATCLWLENLKSLTETNNVYNIMIKLPKKEQQRVWMLPPSKDRWKTRSRTLPGIAKAMATQFTIN